MSSSPRNGAAVACALVLATAMGSFARATDRPAGRVGTLEPVPAEATDYILGAEDLLDIKVVGVEDLSSTVRVASSGNITIPLLGEVQARGLTRSDLERSIAGLLEDRFVNNPQVSVFVKEFGSRMVSVFGAVQRPGRYPMVGRRTLLDLVSDAGGLAEEAGAFAIITHHPASREDLPQTSRVDLEALLYQGQSELNPEILPGDLIHVPADRRIRVYVHGAVKEPGELESPSIRPLTLLQAVTKAGGTTDRAALKKVEILRHENGQQVVLPVNLKAIRNGESPDIVLRDGDVIVIPETYF